MTATGPLRGRVATMEALLIFSRSSRKMARTAFLRARVRGHRLAYLEQMEARERSSSGEGDKILLPEAVRSFIRDWDKDIKL